MKKGEWMLLRQRLVGKGKALVGKSIWPLRGPACARARWSIVNIRDLKNINSKGTPGSI